MVIHAFLGRIIEADAAKKSISSGCVSVCLAIDNWGGSGTDVVLSTGGSEEQQKEFVESLGMGAAKSRDRTKPPPIANEFALGYTYQDVLDADHEGTFSIFIDHLGYLQLAVH